MEDRADIVASLREHIEATLTEGGTTDVDAVLADLGDPLTIAAAANDDATSPTPRPSGRLRGPAVPTVAVFSVLLGSLAVSVLPPAVIVAVVGMVIFWLSGLWSPNEKAAGTFLLPLPGIAVFALTAVAFSVETCESTGSSGSAGSPTAEVVETCTGGSAGWVGIAATALVVVAVVAGVAAAMSLVRRGNEEAAAG